MVYLLDWWRRRRELKEYEQSASCEAMHLELMETKLDLRLKRLQLKMLKYEEKRMKRKPDYVW